MRTQKNNNTVKSKIILKCTRVMDDVVKAII